MCIRDSLEGLNRLQANPEASETPLIGVPSFVRPNQPSILVEMIKRFRFILVRD